MVSGSETLFVIIYFSFQEKFSQKSLNPSVKSLIKDLEIINNKLCICSGDLLRHLPDLRREQDQEICLRKVKHFTMTSSQPFSQDSHQTQFYPSFQYSHYLLIISR